MDTVLILLSIFGGVSGVIAVSGWARAERIRAMGRGRQSAERPEVNDPVLAELKALKQQISEMQNTSHQFDLSFDESLTRLEQRVNHLETKTASPAPAHIETPNVLKNGRST